MSPRTATQPELAALIRPFVGTFREIHRGGNSRLDIHHLTHSIDADVRAVTTEGVSLFFDSRCQLVPWSAINKVVIASGGGQTEYLSEREAEFRRVNAGHRGLAREMAA